MSCLHYGLSSESVIMIIVVDCDLKDIKKKSLTCSL